MRWSKRWTSLQRRRNWRHAWKFSRGWTLWIQSVRNVANKFSVWCDENICPLRDRNSVKNKFGKSTNSKRPIEDPSCSSHLRRAKRISRDILGKTHSVNVWYGDNPVMRDEEEDLEGDASPDDGSGDRVGFERKGVSSARSLSGRRKTMIHFRNL